MGKADLERIERIASRQTGRRLPITTAVALVLYLVAALSAAAPASASCPNEVFRTGPSAKLPDCRAYELVTPEYTGGIKPVGVNAFFQLNGFEFPRIADDGNAILFNSVTGALSGSPGNGFNDQYQSKRTETGWVTEYFGPTAEQTPRPVPGGVSADYQYYFLNAGENDQDLETGATLQAPFGGETADYLRKPNGEFELIGKGSLGSSQRAHGRLITPGGSHIIFTTETQLEPAAPPSGTLAIYDRSAGGPTHVVSLLPNGAAPTTGTTEYLGASEDGTEVAFAQGQNLPELSDAHLYVRRDNSSTVEAVRSTGIVVGKKLTCSGSGAGSVAYQWLRDGVPIPGANSAEYTATVADEGTSLQCLVRAGDSEGEGLATSLPPRIVAPYEGDDSPTVQGSAAEIQVANFSFAEVGESLTCEPGAWEGNPAYSYQWFRDGAEIGGAEAATYTPVGADEDHALQCRLTASNADGAAVGFSRVIPVHPAPPFTTAPPAIANETHPGEAPETGDALSCSPGAWTGSPAFAYQWLRNGTAIAAATGSAYVVVPGDAGATLQCLVTATADVSSQATSSQVVAGPQPAVAPPEPSEGSSAGQVLGGDGRVGEGLFCYSAEWSGEPSFAYQWLRDGAEIPGATEETYLVTSADLGSVIQCRLTATNAGGSMALIYAGSSVGPRYVTPAFPFAGAALPGPGLLFDGIFGGNLFYADPSAESSTGNGDLYSYDIATKTTARITDTGDAAFSNISQDGSRVYFVSESSLGGEGSAGEPNLYVWSRADDSTAFVATVEPADLVPGAQQGEAANLTAWTSAMSPYKESNAGRAASNTRSTANGSVLLFQTTAQLTSFDNTEAAPDECGSKESSGDRCVEAYLYNAETQELTCVSCPPGAVGPATGHVSFFEYIPLAYLNPPANLTQDGNTAIFESSEDLLPRDGNERRDVYRWRKGDGLALITTGQAKINSYLYAVTPNASDVAFLTIEQLLPQDRNGGTERIYDARVGGGFAPPESTVTEPCFGDGCQGNPSAAPSAPNGASLSLEGSGNVSPKRHCAKGKRRVIRHGRERCVKRKHRKHRKHRGHNRRAGGNRGAAQ